MESTPPTFFELLCVIGLCGIFWLPVLPLVMRAITERIENAKQQKPAPEPVPVNTPKRNRSKRNARKDFF